MSKVLIIGAGGVGGVVAHKCAQNPAVFEHIVLASRTKAKCDAIAEEVLQLQGRTITTARTPRPMPRLASPAAMASLRASSSA